MSYKSEVLVSWVRQNKGSILTCYGSNEQNGVGMAIGSVRPYDGKGIPDSIKKIVAVEGEGEWFDLPDSRLQIYLPDLVKGLLTSVIHRQINPVGKVTFCYNKNFVIRCVCVNSLGARSDAIVKAFPGLTLMSNDDKKKNDSKKRGKIANGDSRNGTVKSNVQKKNNANQKSSAVDKTQAKNSARSEMSGAKVKENRSNRRRRTPVRSDVSDHSGSAKSDSEPEDWASQPVTSSDHSARGSMSNVNRLDPNLKVNGRNDDDTEGAVGFTSTDISSQPFNGFASVQSNAGLPPSAASRHSVAAQKILDYKNLQSDEEVNVKSRRSSRSSTKARQ